MPGLSEFTRPSKRLDLLVRGVTERGLFLREWTMGNNFLAAVGKAPEGVDPLELGVQTVADTAYPGFRTTRLEAVQTALTAYLDNEVDSEAVEPVKETEAVVDPFVQELVLNSMRKVIANR